jgi:GAG-pre-integrase domain
MFLIVVLIFLYKLYCRRSKQIRITSTIESYLLMFDVPFVFSAPTLSSSSSQYQYTEPDNIMFKETDDCRFNACRLQTQLDQHRRIYFNKPCGMPIVFDTGASCSISPLREDFIGDLEKPMYATVKGLKGEIKVVGQGIVEWSIFDMDGVVRRIRTKALYIPEGNIRLFSPQVYFQEHMKGHAKIGATGLSWTLSDSTILRFPYAGGSNLPIMLTNPDSALTVGLSHYDVQLLSNPAVATTFVTVADETNQNLTMAQKELLLWHWRLGHINFQWIQMLVAKPQNIEEESFIKTKHSNVSSCALPLCMACQLAKQARRTPDVARLIADPTKVMSTKRDHLLPGQMVSLDQYMGSTPGRLPHTKGKEDKKDKYNGGTIFVDHASGFIFVRNQVSLRSGETIISKKCFETLASSFGVTVKGYYADNVPFNSAEFKVELTSKGQTIDLSGVGAHHQNGVAERSIKTITSLARSMLLHMTFHWPFQADLQLWPFALEYAVFLWNHIPNKQTRISPIELFSSTRFDNREVLRRSRV